MSDLPWIGTAGWSVPSLASGAFGTEGSQLQRYSARLCCAEIDTSFYRSHRPETYARWAASVPGGFRFCVKAPRVVTHEARLRDAHAALTAFIDEVSNLRSRLGPLLFQLPPSLAFDPSLAEAFLGDLRGLFAGEVVLEPRHPSWFEDRADECLRAHRIGRVAADPPPYPGAAAPGGSDRLRYWRLHGSPRMYYSAYGEGRLRALAYGLAPGDWCIFDNTASGAALTDALLLQDSVWPAIALRGAFAERRAE